MHQSEGNADFFAVVGSRGLVRTAEMVDENADH